MQRSYFQLCVVVHIFESFDLSLIYVCVLHHFFELLVLSQSLLETALQLDDGVLVVLFFLLYLFVCEELLLTYHVLTFQFRLEVLVVVLKLAHFV